MSEDFDPMHLHGRDAAWHRKNANGSSEQQANGQQQEKANGSSENGQQQEKANGSTEQRANGAEVAPAFSDEALALHFADAQLEASATSKAIPIRWLSRRRTYDRRGPLGWAWKRLMNGVGID